MKQPCTEVIVPGLQSEIRPDSSQAVELAPRARILATFSNALNPVGPIERFLVAELSQRAAQTRDYDAALEALRREGEAAFLSVLSTNDGNSDSALSLARASVLASEKHEALMRQGLASSRGFMRALHEFREIRASIRELGTGSLLHSDPRFATEQACLAHLARRYVRGSCACRRCGEISAGNFLATRALWQCARCHAQTGLRCGTCMEHSALPLTKWFAAIRIVLLSPTIATEELAIVLKIDRLQTVRNMIKHIRAAANSQDPSVALAGLDELYLGFG
jgi:hypothetical protein